MSSKKLKEKMIKHRICSIARIVACASFLVLAIIGVSSLVRAMSLENIANEKGVPTSWDVASLGNPETITVPITYWDQRQQACDDDDRQFEWSQCELYATGAVQGIVKSRLGTDGLPVPAFSNSSAAWAANRDVFTMNVTGSDPLETTDNFYRWFHEVDGLSKKYEREITFTRTGTNTYKYGNRGIFPIDDVDFSDSDDTTKTGHNFHFTSHLRIPIKISADGTEKFEFLGDDDVWVFLNGQLVLDIGGLHQAIGGSFTINEDGTLSTHVDSVANISLRDSYSADDVPTGSEMNNRRWAAEYRKVVHEVSAPAKSDTIDLGLKAGDVVNLDFFYAERSTTESNTEITISNMNWPISADSDVHAKVVSKTETSVGNLVQFNTSVTNRDPDHPLDVERMAAFIRETTADETKEGYLPLDAETLEYTLTPNDPDSWQPVEVTAPANSSEGFNLITPIRMSAYGQSGDTVHFRYFGETSSNAGTITSLVSYYTSLNGTTGFTYDYDTVTYKIEPSSTPVDPTPTPHNLTITYIYADDKSQAAEPHTDTLNPGDPFDVPSPSIDGYTPNILKVTGTMDDDDMSYIVEYSKIPEEQPEPDPETHTVTIHYIYEDGTKAAEDYKEDFKTGDTFEVPSPSITDYTPDQTVVKDTVGTEDQEYIVRYKKDGEPTPVVPDQPTTPFQPVTPAEPELPDSDIFDDPLDYTPPLGEVAYVPNTGLIDDLVAPIFEQYFASVILSQGMVLAVLLIFASSFATYFSLRRYLDFTMTPATATRTANKSRISKATKTTKSLAKSSAKTAKTATSAKTARKK